MNKSRRQTCHQNVSYLLLDDWPPIIPIAPQIAVERSFHFEPEFIVAAVVLGEERAEVGGKPLVQPDVRPILTGQEIAEPLVGELVRDQAVFVALRARRFRRGAAVSVIVVAVMFSMPPAMKSGTHTWAYLA